MSEAPASTLPAPAGLSLIARFWGILFSPRATFVDVAAKPKWFGMMALVIVVAVVCTGGFLMSKVGQEAWLDAVYQRADSQGTPMSEQAAAMMEKIKPYVGLMAVVQFIVVGPLLTLALAGIFFAVFNAALGGDATYRQIFTVVVHASVPTVVQQLFVTPLNYFRGSMMSATNLSVFLPMLDESSFLSKFFGTIDLFLLWWVLVLAIGLGVLYRRKTGPIAISLFVVYGVIAVIIAWFTSGRAGA